MKLALYARNSKPPRGWKPSHPGEEPPGSWKQQLDALREWAARNGHEVVLEKHDAKKSGRDPNRPDWEAVMQEARGHHIQAVAATKLDRVMRSVPHFYEVASEFMGLGVDLTFIDTGLSLSKRDPFSKATLGILAVVAELELDLARERQADVMRRGEDGRLYGPRSERPSGRPGEYGEGHRFRIRAGSRVHDKARCRVCRGEKGGVGGKGSGTRPQTGDGEAGGFATLRSR